MKILFIIIKFFVLVYFTSVFSFFLTNTIANLLIFFNKYVLIQSYLWIITGVLFIICFYIFYILLKNKTIVFQISITIIVAIILLFIILIPKLVIESKASYCETDHECVLVKNDCCGCNEGGSCLPANKEYQEYYDKINSKWGCACLTVITPTLPVACVENKCVFKSE
jgi:hypothetical protein